MRETQQSIAAWSIATFGPAATDFRVATRAHEEVSELLRGISAGRAGAEVIAECADVAIVICNLADRYAERCGIGAAYDAIWNKLPEPTLNSRALSAVRVSRVLNRIMTAIVSEPHGFPPPSSFTVIMGDLADICGGYGTTLAEAVDAKMAINRVRKWKQDGWSGDGSGYHVREGSRDIAEHVASEPRGAVPAHDGTGRMIHDGEYGPSGVSEEPSK